MRKSFILSLVMVVVLIASLATATFAWYTSQVQVNTTEATVTTAGAGKSIVISAAEIPSTTTPYQNKVVTLVGSDTPVAPMIVSAEPTTSTTYSSIAFVTANVTSDNKAAGVGAGTPATIASVTDVDNTDKTSSLIYVANTGSTASLFTVKVIISSDQANKGLRVAVFKMDGTTSSATDSDEPANANAFKLVGIWAPEGETVGYQSSTLANGNDYNAASGIFTGKETKIAISADTSTIVYASNTAAAAGTLAAVSGSTVTSSVFAVKTWFEGANVTNQYQGKTAQYQLYFDLGADA